MPIIPVRGYTCDIVPKNPSDRLPEIDSVFRWYHNDEGYFMSKTKDNTWRIALFLDVAPSDWDFCDPKRVAQIEKFFMNSIGKGLGFEVKF